MQHLYACSVLNLPTAFIKLIYWRLNYPWASQIPPTLSSGIAAQTEIPQRYFYAIWWLLQTDGGKQTLLQAAANIWNEHSLPNAVPPHSACEQNSVRCTRPAVCCRCGCAKVCFCSVFGDQGLSDGGMNGGVLANGSQNCPCRTWRCPDYCRAGFQLNKKIYDPSVAER
jgi:hypothetical protein